MRIDILTLFPGMFRGPFEESMIKRAVERELIDIRVHDLREYGLGRHRQVDDYPYGGGAGMVLRPEPVFAAVEAVLGAPAGGPAGEAEGTSPPGPPIVLMSPQGRLFRQAIARELAEQPWLVLLCGHYEGVDERIRAYLATDEISIGDYVLTGGELPAMVVVDSVVRLVPGVLGSAESVGEESFARGLLEYPHYTRPAEFRGWPVPDVLLSGHHAQIARWRREQALRRTFERRPDLLATADLSPEAQRVLAVLADERARGGSGT